MEGKASGADEKVAKERYEEYAIMAILPAVEHSPEGEVYEQEIGQRINDLGGVLCGIVVLVMRSQHMIVVRMCDLYLTSSHQSRVEVIGAQ